MVKGISIGRHLIPLWLIVVLLFSGIGLGLLGDYVWKTLTIPVQVKEPIEILGYPPKLSLYAGETKFFTVNLTNHGSVDYSIALNFHMSNATYQNNYVTFSNETYEIVPGQQNITAWFDVESYAPSTNDSLTIDFERVQSLFFNDGFDRAYLRNEWRFVDIDGGSNVNVTDEGMLRLTTVSRPWRDLQGSYENAPHIVLPGVRGNFSIETSVFAVTNESEEGAGILVWKGPHSHLRFERICKAANSGLVEQQILLTVEGGESITLTLSSPPLPIFLKLIRSGLTFSGYYSTLGMLRGWYYVGNVTFQTIDPLEVGLDIINAYHDGVFSADFDYFKMMM
jgi:hypothetical protein